jgi:multisubunit Na+/H+ antiporter MnhC subunit
MKEIGNDTTKPMRNRVMRLYEAVAVIMVGAIVLLFVIGRTNSNGMLRITENRLRAWAAIASPLVVAAVLTIGFVVLGAENLTGGTATRQVPVEHSTAIQNLFFRH